MAPGKGKPGISDNSTATTVAICICTYRRPAGLRRLLEGLAAQAFPDTPAPTISVVVTDNEGNPESRDICDGFRQTGLSLTYNHEPRQGISHARNACLDNLPAGTDFVAMIDDDESPDSHWLNHLLLAQSHTAADIVVGPTLPAFEEGVADWIRASGFFAKPENPECYADLQPDPPAATCNVLVKAEIFSDAGMRFDPRLALSGGEDKLLFQDLKLRGYRFAWAADAKVTEYIPRERASFNYMWREAYRRGNVKHYVKRQLKISNRLKLFILVPKSLVRAVVQILTGSYKLTIQFVTDRKNRAQLVLHALAIADGLGTIAGLLRLENRHYRHQGTQC